jgi:glutamate formiminotransferase
MSIVWIPNVSEGRDPEVIDALVEAASPAGARVLDVHSDAAHHRTVITATAAPDVLVDAATALARRAAELVDLRTHEGSHPRVGALDVCPFVPHEGEMDDAVGVARNAARAIADRAGLPVYLYGAASERGLELPDVRRGGLDALARRAAGELPPDMGRTAIDPARGVVCVGARGPLIAFNVWLDASLEAARTIARAIRGPAVRALGLQMDRHAQVSMNLIDPGVAGIDEVFHRIQNEAGPLGARVSATEIVGLVPARFLPDPDAEAARLLREPGRSLESELAKS